MSAVVNQVQAWGSFCSLVVSLALCGNPAVSEVFNGMPDGSGSYEELV